MGLQILITNINDAFFGFPIENCNEVQDSVDIQRIPFLKEYILGLANFRGDVFVIIDLINLINGKKTVQNQKNPILRIKYEEQEVAVLVNQIIDVVEVPIDQLNDSKKYLSLKESEYVSYLVENELGLIRVIQVEKLVKI